MILIEYNILTCNLHFKRFVVFRTVGVANVKRRVHTWKEKEPTEGYLEVMWKSVTFSGYLEDILD